MSRNYARDTKYAGMPLIKVMWHVRQRCVALITSKCGRYVGVIMMSLRCEYSDTYSGMTNILDNNPTRPADPILAVRKGPHAQVWSVWATPEGADAVT